MFSVSKTPVTLNKNSQCDVTTHFYTTKANWGHSKLY